MKRITINKILIWIYALLMCLPLISVGFRSLYVTFNENAYESYYGETINQENNVLISNIDDFKLNQVYIFDTYDAFINSNSNLGAWAYTMNINNVKLVNTNATLNQNASNIKALALYYNTSYQGHAQIQITYNDDNTQSFNQNINFRFYFNYISNDLNVNWAQYNYFYEVEYNNYSYLDNAFDYSLHEFIDNNNTGLINFVGLFSDMFLGNSNVENSLYLGFANFMMNYALFITCAYFVFEVLMWFINYVRKYMYSLENKGD